MDPRTTPVPLVRPGPSLRLVERKDDRRTELADAVLENLARQREAEDLIEACLPLAHRLEFAAQLIGPQMHHTAIELIARLTRYGRQNGRAA